MLHPLLPSPCRLRLRLGRTLLQHFALLLHLPGLGEVAHEVEVVLGIGSVHVGGVSNAQLLQEILVRDVASALRVIAGEPEPGMPISGPSVPCTVPGSKHLPWVSQLALNLAAQFGRVLDTPLPLVPSKQASQQSCVFGPLCSDPEGHSNPPFAIL